MDGKTPLIIEIKSRHEYTGEYLDALCHATLDGLKGYNGPYCIESFDPRVVKRIRKFAPQVLRGQLVDSYRAYRKEGANPIHAFVISHCFGNFMARPDFIAWCPDKQNWAVRLCARLGAMMVMWTALPEHDQAALENSTMPSSSSGTTRKSSTNKNRGSKYSSPLISLRKSIATFLRGAAFMFLFTVTKPGLRQAGALALCAVCLAGTVTAAVRLAGKSVTASATVQTTIENTQDIGTYFTGYGFEVDLSTAAVDKVKIPKKWDDSFTAFNQVVGESGLTLADYKGKRWKMDGTLPGALRWRNRHLLCAAGI